VAHQRSVAALKTEIGPHDDFSSLWNKHCEYEFATRNVADTMATMVTEPYVNHTSRP
jgi:carboxymethylenebutenolidase